MVKKWRFAREIKELRTLRVSAQGTGLYLFLPKRFCETYGVNGGDQIKVQLRDLFTRDWKGEGEDQTKGG